MGLYVQTLLVIVLSVLAWVIDSHLIDDLGRGCYSFVAFDTILILLTLLNGSSEYGATMGAFQWTCYTLLTMIKLLIWYFLCYDREVLNHPQPIVELAVYSVGLPYVLWMVRSYYQLFGTKDFLPLVETFMFTDMIFHVSADLVDASAAFVFLFDCSASFRLKESWLLIIDGILVGLSWFLHMYSFPSRGRCESSDILLTRKWVSLVSVFIVDLPQLSLRAYVWINYPLMPGLQGILLKNIVSIPLNVFRFTQCRRLEPTVTKSPQAKALTSRRMTHALQGSAAATDGEEGVDTSLPSLADKMGVDKPTTKLLEQIEASSTIPVKRTGFKQVCRKVYNASAAGMWNSFRSHSVTTGPVTAGQERRLTAALLISNLTMMLIPIGMYVVRRDVTESELLPPLSAAPELAASTLGGVYAIGAMLGCSFMYVLCFVKLAPMSALLTSLICHTAWLSVWWTMCKTVAFGSIRSVAGGSGGLIYVTLIPRDKRWLSMFMVLLPLARFVRYCYFFTWRGKNRSVNPDAESSLKTNGGNKQSKKLITDDFIKIDQLVNTDIKNIIREFTPEDREPQGGPYASIYERMEHQGYVRYSSILLLYVCKHTCAPIPFHSRLSNSDIVKSTRESDYFLYLNHKIIGIYVTYGLLSIVLLRDPLTLTQVPCSLAILLIYALTCHAQRLISLRSFECQALAESIVKDYENVAPADEAPQASGFVLTADPQLDGFFSSPGNLFPA